MAQSKPKLVGNNVERDMVNSDLLLLFRFKMLGCNFEKIF